MVNIGDKIVVTDTEYPASVPNGTVMTVSSLMFYPEEGYVNATVDGGDDFLWFMENGRYEPYYSERTLKAVAQLNEPVETHKMPDDTPKLEADKPTLWKDMTPEEKGALLLAHHEGKTIEYFCHGFGWKVERPNFFDWCAYRIKPEVKRETVNCLWAYEKGGKEGYCHPINYSATHKITFDLIDGIPDPDSIKIMEV